MATEPAVKIGHHLRDVLLSALALRQEKITVELVGRGKKISEEMERFGISRTIVSLLVERKLIDRSVERDAVKEFARIALKCPHCRRPVSLESLGSEGQLRCAQCEGAMSVELAEDDPVALARCESGIESRLRVSPLAAGEGTGREGPRKGPPGGSAAPGGTAGARSGAAVGNAAPAGPARARKHAASAEPPGTKGSVAPESLPASAEEAAPKAKIRINPRSAIKRFAVEGVVAHGSHGRLYRARPVRAGGRPYVVKVLHQDPAPPRDALQALRERFQAWNLLPTAEPPVAHSLEEEGGVVFVARPGIENPYRSLADVKPEELRDPGSLMRGICQALDPLHRSGGLHGNLKPSNVFVVLGKEAKEIKVLLVDPALELLVPAGEGTSRWQALAESPVYHAPEEIAGKRLTPATDVYVLGWIFHAILAGCAPFQKLPAPEILRRHREGPCPELPDDRAGWRALIGAMTALKSEERPEDAAAVLAHVEAVLAGKKPALAPVTPRAQAPRIEEGRRKAPLHAGWYYAAGPAILAAAALWAGAAWWLGRDGRAAFADPNRQSALFRDLTSEAFRKTSEEARAHPEDGRAIWDRYLETFSGTPLEGAAKAEHSNYPAPLKPRPPQK